MRSEDYLAVIYRLNEAGIEARLSFIAENLGVKASTATRVLSKLEREGYVVKRGPVYSLTQKGAEKALKIVCNHRIVERFLTDILKVDLWEAHNLAHELEHVDSFAELLDEYLGRPSQCPHGNPVPTRVTEYAIPLSSAGKGAYTVVRIGEVGGLVDWGRKLALKAGDLAEVSGFEGNDIIVSVSGRRLRIPLHIARLIYVRKVVK